MENILSHDLWTQLATDHIKEIEKLAEPWKNAKDRKAKHPVIDFLFQYYSFPYNRLKSWTPGFGVKLEPPFETHLSKERFEEKENSIELKRLDICDKF